MDVSPQKFTNSTLPGSQDTPLPNDTPAVETTQKEVIAGLQGWWSWMSMLLKTPRGQGEERETLEQCTCGLVKMSP